MSTEPPTPVAVFARLGRGIVWSDLLAAMEQEWRDRAGDDTVALRRSAGPEPVGEAA